ncbi:hypothetical protein BDZ89DRAFT_570048 [Hymenopellis radicata]|nr:hypothetical protein BDZ89DRAFT_570048 [Hymenopellis radicata]
MEEHIAAVQYALGDHACSSGTADFWAIAVAVAAGSLLFSALRNALQAHISRRILRMTVETLTVDSNRIGPQPIDHHDLSGCRRIVCSSPSPSSMTSRSRSPPLSAHRKWKKPGQSLAATSSAVHLLWTGHFGCW